MSVTSSSIGMMLRGVKQSRLSGTIRAK